jgi:cytoskeletal protein CcmA (bactofilin family)
MSQLSSSPVSILGPGLLLKGEVHSTGPLQISGRIEGPILCQDAVEITPEGSVEGDIKAGTIEIQGTVEGNVETDVCRLGASAHLTGELRSATLAIAEGATFVGKVIIGNGEAAAAAPQPVAQSRTEAIPEPEATPRTVQAVPVQPPATPAPATIPVRTATIHTRPDVQSILAARSGNRLVKVAP